MKTNYVLLAFILLVPHHLPAQTQEVASFSVITMNEEPHHHREMHNEYVNVLTAKVRPGDSVLLHRHDHDAIAIAIGNEQVTVSVPGKPDVHQNNADGQVRIQSSGYIHSTHVDGPDAYYTVAIELLDAQTGKRNVCAVVMAGQSLNCPAPSTDASSGRQIVQQQFVSDQTHIDMIRVLPHQQTEVGGGQFPRLVVALDPALLSGDSGENADKLLHPGNFVWLEKGATHHVVKNNGDKEVRLVKIDLIR